MARLAFVFGSNGAQSFGPLKYANKDADNVAAALAGPRCDFSVTRPTLRADAYDIRRQLNQLAATCRPEDTFIGYFAGHGVLDAGELFLVCDETTEELFVSALPVGDILTAMKRCRARNRLLILDCCHAGGAVGTRDGLGVPAEELKINTANHLILMASGRLEKAREFDELEGGFLAAQLCSALGEHFHTADQDDDGRVSIRDLMTWLEERAVAHNNTSRHKVPVPRLFGEQQGELFLTKDRKEWIPHEIHWPDGTTMVILPIAPLTVFDRYRRDRSSWNEGDCKAAIAIGKQPITNAQYKRFVMSTDASPPSGQRFERTLSGGWTGPFNPWDDPNFKSPEQPVVCVSYDDTLSYCRWVQRQQEQSPPFAITDVPPTQIWDYAAYGVGYPTQNPTAWRGMASHAHHKSSAPAPIDVTGARTNERGVSDLFGNVWEWCGTMYGMLARSGIRPHGDYFGPEDQRQAVVATSRRDPRERAQLRGGGFIDDLTQIEPFLRASELKDGRQTRHADTGFRICALIPTVTLPAHVNSQLDLCRPLEDLDHQIRVSARGENTDF